MGPEGIASSVLCVPSRNAQREHLCKHEEHSNSDALFPYDGHGCAVLNSSERSWRRKYWPCFREQSHPHKDHVKCMKLWFFRNSLSTTCTSVTLHCWHYISLSFMPHCQSAGGKFNGGQLITLLVMTSPAESCCSGCWGCLCFGSFPFPNQSFLSH